MPELEPIFVELAGLNDNAAGNELNRRKVKALNGGRWRCEQVRRARARLALRGQLWLLEHIQKTLIEAFGREPADKVERSAIEFAKWAAFKCSMWNHSAENGGRNYTAQNLREFRRAHCVLGLALDALRVASDHFEQNHGNTTALGIWELATKLLLEIEAVLTLQLAATSEVADTPDAASAS